MKKGIKIKKFLLVFVMVGALVMNVSAEDAAPFDTTLAEPPKTSEEEAANTEKAYQIPVDSNAWEGWPQGPETYGEAGIVMDAQSGAVLYAKNINGKAYPASITKVLTTLVALENAKLDDKVTVTEHSIECLGGGYAHIGLSPGEEISMKDALYAVLLASANEAAEAVGESVGKKMGKDYDWFIEQMNTRAKELGAVNSNFENTNGVENQNHYTTAYDMALITRELLNNHPEFEKICQTLEYKIGATNKTTEERIFQQKDKMYYEGNTYYYPYIIAGKTGYTDEAMNTLITCAEKDGRRLISVVLKTHGRNVYTDSMNLLNYGFDEFETMEIPESDIEEKMDGAAYVSMPKGISFNDLKREMVPDEKDETKSIYQYTYQGKLMGTTVVSMKDTGNGMEADENDSGSTEALKNSSTVNVPTGKIVPLWAKIVLGILIALIIALFLWLLIAAQVRKSRRKKRRKKKQQEMMRRRQEIQRRENTYRKNR